MNDQNNTQEMPVIKFKDTPFYIDAEGQQFIEVENPINRIPFDDFIELDDCFYGIRYRDPNKNIAPNENFHLMNNASEIALPNELVFSPRDFVAHALKDESYCQKEVERVGAEMYAYRKIYQQQINKDNQQTGPKTEHKEQQAKQLKPNRKKGLRM